MRRSLEGSRALNESRDDELLPPGGSLPTAAPLWSDFNVRRRPLRKRGPPDLKRQSKGDRA